MDTYDQHNNLDTASMLVACGLAILLIGYTSWKGYGMYTLLSTQKAFNTQLNNAQLDNQKQKPASTKLQPYHALASENYLFGKAEANKKKVITRPKLTPLTKLNITLKAIYHHQNQPAAVIKSQNTSSLFQVGRAYA